MQIFPTSVFRFERSLSNVEKMRFKISWNEMLLVNIDDCECRIRFLKCSSGPSHQLQANPLLIVLHICNYVKLFCVVVPEHTKSYNMLETFN